ncbi:MAG TPA: hypothetical protein VMV10_05155 [Pirellulales bacterium]|nr:hypothetical protein [Pirellulales bacterium]
MSTLDQAFIRAYQKQRVIPAPHVAFPAAGAKTLDEAPPAPSIAAPVASETVDLPSQPEPEITALASAPMPQPTAVRAALEVEQFDWPEAVEALRLSSADGFAAWSEQFSRDGSVTLLAVSSARGAGRTTVLLAAARHLSLTRAGAKIVLVDADFRRPQLALRLGVAVELGWEDVLSDEQPLAEALVESGADRLTLLPLRAEVDDARLAACGARLCESLRVLQQSFDFICIDAGPLAAAPNAFEGAMLAREANIDAALVVRDMRKASGEDNSAIGRRLAERGVRHWDLVENFVQSGG